MSKITTRTGIETKIAESHVECVMDIADMKLIVAVMGDDESSVWNFSSFRVWAQNATIDLSFGGLTVAKLRKLANELSQKTHELQTEVTNSGLESLLHRHVFCFNPEDNGGEAIHLVTNFVSDGGNGLVLDQELSLSSYGNGVSINGLFFIPVNLRELANALEEAEIQARTIIQENKKQDQVAVRA